LVGGGVVTITGNNFTGATAVKFGTTAASSFTIDSGTQITVTVPAHAAGIVDVTVTTPAGTSALSSHDKFTYQTAPTVTSLRPSAGPTSGGTSVVITGSNFTGATVVRFGTTLASSFTVNSATRITAVAPASSTGIAGLVDISITTPAGTSATSSASQFTYVTPPAVSSISPSSGARKGGTVVTILGRNFTGTTTVKFGTRTATRFTVNSPTQITATSPAGAVGSVDITVTTANGGTSVATPATDQFTYVEPLVTATSPSAGPLTAGTVVTISGSNFTGATAVKFGTTAASSFTIDSDTQITVIAPAHAAGIVDITVTSPAGTSALSSHDKFTYQAAPSVTSLSPRAGPTTGGTSVVITGSNFTGASAVRFGTTPASSFTVNSATRITAVAPANSAATVDITVTAPGGTSAVATADKFTYQDAPLVTSISPRVGKLAGGTVVTVGGSNFTRVSAVKFGTIVVSRFTVNSAGTQITVTAPAHVVGTVDITVVTPGGTSAVSAGDQFTYQSAPAVTSISPFASALSGGGVVTITGNNFTGATAVKFGTTAASSFTIDSGTQITVTVPAHAAGIVDVTVTTPAGTSALSSHDKFTYQTAPSVTSVNPSAGPIMGGTSGPRKRTGQERGRSSFLVRK
jgi:hypothetical protein